MDMVNFTTKMVECMMVIGMKIKCKVLENYSINRVNLHIKANGKMINLLEKVFYIIKYRKY
jgi:hypothetical protein